MDDLHILAHPDGLGRREADAIGLTDALADRVQIVVHAFAQLLQLVLGNLRLLLHGFQLADDAVRLPAGVFQNAPGLRLGLLHALVLALLDLPAELFGLVAQADGLFAGLLRHLPLPLGDLPVVLRVGDHVLEAHVLLAQQLLGAVDQPLVQPQLAGDLEGVALAGNADGQPVGGPQGFHVELHAGVFHAGGA